MFEGNTQKLPTKRETTNKTNKQMNKQTTQTKQISQG